MIHTSNLRSFSHFHSAKRTMYNMLVKKINSPAGRKLRIFYLTSLLFSTLVTWKPCEYWGQQHFIFPYNLSLQGLQECTDFSRLHGRVGSLCVHTHTDARMRVRAHTDTHTPSLDEYPAPSCFLYPLRYWPTSGINDRWS